MADDETDDAPRSVRDLRIMWRTVVTAAIVVASCIGAVIYVTTEWTRLITRVENVEKWQAQKEREAARELWRQRLKQPEVKP